MIGNRNAIVVAALLVGVGCLISTCSNLEEARIEDIKTQSSAFQEEDADQFEARKSKMFERRLTKWEREYITDLFWTSGSDKLYFASRPPKESKKYTYLRYYDLKTKQIGEIDVGNLWLYSFDISSCDDIAAVAKAYDSRTYSIFIYMDGKTHFYTAPDIGIYGRPYWISGCDSAMLMFYGTGPGTEDILLWSRTDSELRVVTPFDDRLSEEIYRLYKRFSGSSVQGKVVFDYILSKEVGDSRLIRYHFGAMNLATGQAWKIIDHGEGINRSRIYSRVDSFNWFCSRKEDAIYFFTIDESSRLDALWKIDSAGENMKKVLDGKEIGKPYWSTTVSWSEDGKSFSFTLENPEDYSREGIYQVDVTRKESTKLVCDAGRGNFSSSPDGKKIAYIPEDHNLYILDINSGNKELIHSVE